MQPTIENHQTEWAIKDVEALDVPDWWRYQIVDGTLFVSPSAGGFHELASAEVRAALWTARPEGVTVFGPVGIDLGATYLIPDLVVMRRDSVQAGNQSPSDIGLVVEIVSPGSVTMDRLVKPAKYAAAGIPLFWRIERRPTSLTAYRLDGDRYAEVGSWSAGEVAELTEPFPVRIDLTTLG